MFSLLYISDDLIFKPCDIKVPDELECVWGVVDGNFLFNVKKLAVCSVYYPPRADHHDALIEHLISTCDALRTQYNDLRIVIMGDLNGLNIEQG